jgi:hypothetical protein
MVPQIIFFGRDEFAKLYQSALRGPVTRWVLEQQGWDFATPNLNTQLQTEIHEHTWFCAVSDSMQISDFCHANHLGGIDYRPDLRTLCKFGDLNLILDFMQKRPLRRIVVLEDFIGSGTQLLEAKQLIRNLLDKNVPILLVPLIICPDGVSTIEQMFGANNLFRLDPVLRLDRELLINGRSSPPVGSFPEKVTNLAQRCYGQVVGNDAANPRPYSAFGFPAPDGTGALVVLYSNTPANTLALIQHGSNTWTPLFPRSARVK